jgi:NhaP-type Na+/H+ or K+/H+ antiporter
MPSIVYEIINLLASILRLIGMAVLGLGIGWLALDLLKKMQVWQVQIAVFFGLAGLIIAMAVFTGVGALGAFALGVGVAILLWGMPKKQKKEEEISQSI